MSEKETRIIELKVTTDAPGFEVRFEDESLQFDENGYATVERPVGWDCTFYYELFDAEKGKKFKLEITGASKAIDLVVSTDAKSLFGFTGFVIQ